MYALYFLPLSLFASEFFTCLCHCISACISFCCSHLRTSVNRLYCACACSNRFFWSRQSSFIHSSLFIPGYSFSFLLTIFSLLLCLPLFLYLYSLSLAFQRLSSLACVFSFSSFWLHSVFCLSYFTALLLMTLSHCCLCLLPASYCSFLPLSL